MKGKVDRSVAVEAKHEGQLADLSHPAYSRARRSYVWPILDRAAVESGLPLILESGRGARVRDVDGREFVDLMSGISRASTLGYGSERVVAAASEQMARLHYGGTAAYISDVTIELADKLAELTPGDLAATAFAVTGSEANEVATKLARLYQRQHGKPRAYKVISRWSDFHGSSGAAQEASDWRGVRTAAEPAVAGFSRIPNPDNYEIPFDMSAESYWKLCADYLARHIEHEGPELVSALLIEPVGQANGVQVPPQGYLRRIREICDEYQVVLIADEVITGFGRTGKWFAVDHWDVEPDIITLGKGITAGYIPLAAAVCSERIRDALDAFPDIHTFGGHAAAAAASLAAIAVYQDEGLVDRASALGARTFERLKQLEDLSAVGQVRGLGLWLAIDFAPAVATGTLSLRELVLRARELGVIVGDNGRSIELAPPLNVDEGDLDKGLAAFEQAVREVTATGR